MNFINRMIDIENEYEGSEVVTKTAAVEDFAEASKKDLEKLCESQSKNLTKTKDAYSQLLGETKSLRTEYDGFKEKSKRQQLNFEKEIAEYKKNAKVGVTQAECIELLTTQLKEAAESSTRIEQQQIAEREQHTSELISLKEMMDTERLTHTEEQSVLEDKITSLKSKLQTNKEIIERAERAESLLEEVKSAKATVVNSDTTEQVRDALEQLAVMKSNLSHSNKKLEVQESELQQAAEKSTSDDAELKRLKDKLNRISEEHKWEDIQSANTITEMKGKSEQLEMLLSAADAKAARLTAEYSNKDAELKSNLKDQETALKSEITILEETISDLREQLSSSQKKLTDLGTSQEDRAAAIGSQHLALQEQLETTEVQLRTSLEHYSKVTQELKLATDKAMMYQDELTEVVGENQRKDEVLRCLTIELDTCRETVRGYERQAVDNVSSLQARDDEVALIEKERQDLCGAARQSEVQIDTVTRENDSLKLQLTETQQLLEEADQYKIDIEKALQSERARSKEQLETSTNLGDLSAAKEEEVEILRQKLRDSENRNGEVLRLKDQLNARIRNLERSVRDNEVASTVPQTIHTIQSAVRSKSVNRSQSVASPFPSSSSFTKLNWNSCKIMAVVMIALIWLVGMYHNFSSGTATASSNETEKAVSHLQSLARTQAAVLLECRLELQRWIKNGEK